MISIEGFNLDELRALNKLVQKKYTKTLKGGARRSKKQARWHGIGLKVLVALTREKNK